MHKEILNQAQINLLPLLKLFSKDFGLVGGTAIALHLGHRQSLDFDLFSTNKFNSSAIRQKIASANSIGRVFKDSKEEYSILVNKVKLTFLYYPFKISFIKNFVKIKMPDLLTLAAMKAYALGRRAKWKDYVDLYFIIKDFHSIDQINKKAKQIFKSEFNEKIFRSQLGYFKDLDYTEKIIYAPGFAVSDEIIKQALIKFSLA